MSNNPFMDQQMKLFEMWKEQMKNVPGMEAYTEVFEEMSKGADSGSGQKTEEKVNPGQYWQSFTEMPGMDAWASMFKGPMGMGQWADPFKMQANPMQEWMKMVSSMANPMDYWKNMTTTIPGMNVYNEMMDLWKDLQNPEEFAKSFPGKYSKLMQSALQNFMPFTTGQFMGQPTELMDSLINLYQYLFSPWMEIDEDIFNRIASGDSRAYVDFFREFQDKYSETFKKVFNMMGMGLNRESNEDVMKLMDSYFQALYAAGELMALIYNTWQESAQDLVMKYQEMLAEGKTITTFKEFYDFWFRHTEDALEGLFDTDEFAKTFGNFSDMYAQYMIASNKVMERMLSPLPIPTKKDMDSLYKTVYDLRKEVRDIKREIKEIKSELAKKGETK